MSVLVPLSQLTAVERWLGARGIQREILIAEASLPAALLEGDPQSLVALPWQTQLHRAATALTGDPTCPLDAARRAPAGSYLLAELPLLAASDPAELLACVQQRWQRPALGISASCALPAADTIALTLFDSVSEPSRWLLLLGTWLRLLGSLGLEISSLSLPLPPEPALGELAPAVAFGSPLLAIEARVGASAFQTQSSATYPWLMRVTAEDGELPSLEAKLRQEIRLLLHRGEPLSLRAISRGTALSTRTLQRRLQQEGIRFRELVAAERCAYAALLLRSGSVSIKEIASRAGFHDTSSFDRAFRLWSGLTPGEWRDQAPSPG